MFVHSSDVCFQMSTEVVDLLFSKDVLLKLITIMR